jgi:hypothetical protein
MPILPLINELLLKLVGIVLHIILKEIGS